MINFPKLVFLCFTSIALLGCDVPNQMNPPMVMEVGKSKQLTGVMNIEKMNTGMGILETEGFTMTGNMFVTGDGTTCKSPTQQFKPASKTLIPFNIECSDDRNGIVEVRMLSGKDTAPQNIRATGTGKLNDGTKLRVVVGGDPLQQIKAICANYYDFEPGSDLYKKCVFDLDRANRFDAQRRSQALAEAFGGLADAASSLGKPVGNNSPLSNVMVYNPAGPFTGANTITTCSGVGGLYTCN